jgi:hypothetical protein
MIRISMLRRQTSHLLLIHTNLGYGTALMVACGCQGCNATDYLLFIYLYSVEYNEIPKVFFTPHHGQ